MLHAVKLFYNILYVFFHMMIFPVVLKYHKKYYFWLLEAWLYVRGDIHPYTIFHNYNLKWDGYLQNCPNVYITHAVFSYFLWKCKIEIFKTRCHLIISSYCSTVTNSRWGFMSQNVRSWKSSSILHPPRVP